MKCIYCDKTTGIEGHHIWPLSAGGPDEAYNIIQVCGFHHGVLHGMARSDISALTKRGLQRARERGVMLGNTSNLTTAQRLGVAARSAQEALHLEQVLPIMLELKSSNNTLKEIAIELTRRGVPTCRGGNWSAASVCRALAKTK